MRFVGNDGSYLLKSVHWPPLRSMSWYVVICSFTEASVIIGVDQVSTLLMVVVDEKDAMERVVVISPIVFLAWNVIISTDGFFFGSSSLPRLTLHFSFAPLSFFFFVSRGLLELSLRTLWCGTLVESADSDFCS